MEYELKVIVNCCIIINSPVLMIFLNYKLAMILMSSVVLGVVDAYHFVLFSMINRI